MVLLTSGSFVVTWVPYFIACCMYVACDWEETPARCRSIQFAIASPLAILGFANSLTNPFIYAWWHNGFRESAKAIFCGANCRKGRASESDGPTVSTGRTSASSGNARAVASGGRKPMGLSTTTLDASATEGEEEEGSVSDVESALRYRMVQTAPSGASAVGGDGVQEQQQQRRPPAINGNGSGAVNVCYQSDATPAAGGPGGGPGRH